METYKEFLDRINSFEKSETYFGEGYIHVSPSVGKKVYENNQFRPFYGDTIVFNLKDETKHVLGDIVERLYEAAPACFCEKLVSNTFHMTLHDLSNAEDFHWIGAEAFENELKVIERAKKVACDTIRMKTKYIFNMVNTSLVLGLYPADEAEYEKLMNLYFLFDDVRPLPYPLTPHITLAYYNVHGFWDAEARKLEAVIRELNTLDMEIELDVKQLFYQKFVSMNDYINVVCIGDRN